MRKNHRIISLVLATLMLLSSVSFAGFLTHAVAEDGIGASAVNDLIIRDDALHFLIRHWHT